MMSSPTTSDGLEQVPQAHDDMEHDRATGKLVVRVRYEDVFERLIEVAE